MGLSQLTRRVFSKLRSDGAAATLRAGTAFVRTPLRKRIVRWRLGDRVPVAGVTVHLADVPLDSELAVQLHTGTYENDEAEAIREYVSAGMDVVDLEACLGFTSCVANEHLAGDATHVAVEPNPRVWTALQRTRDVNGCEFDVVRAAYDPTEESITLASTSSAWSASPHRHGGDSTEVETVDLRTLIERFDMDDVMGIVDIEGHEAELIENELDVLESCCRVLIVEFHDGQPGLDEARRDRISEARTRLVASEFDRVRTEGNVAVFTR